MDILKQSIVTAIRASLKRLAQLTIWRYRPGIVGVTGNVGKTSAKLAIAAVLGAERKVRWSQGNLNNEFGLPLTILGAWGPDELRLVSRGTPAGEKRLAKAAFWLRAIGISFWRLVTRATDYPEILVLEYGADRPGDLRYLLSLARPNVSVITAIGDIPVHVEYFAGPQELAREKARIIEVLPSAGFAVLNYDDDVVMGLKDRTRAHMMTFGFKRGADVQIVNFETRIEGDRATGISFKLEYGGNSVPVKVDGALGRSQAYAAAAAACVGLIFGSNLVKISQSLAHYIPADSRMQLLPGVKQTQIVSDCYNASPLSMQAALETLRTLPGKRKVAVLGDMLELGRFAIEAHERIGRVAAASANVLVTIGPRAKFIADSAKAAGLNRRNIVSFDRAEDAARPVQDLIRKGDLILVKASRGIHLEKVVDEIKAVAGPELEA